MRAVRFHFSPSFDGRTGHGSEFYHRDLIEAELLLERAVAAAAADLRPIHPKLGMVAIQHAVQRPARAHMQGEVGTPEYVRWYESGGSARLRPLTKEALVRVLARGDGLSNSAAAHLVEMHSYALSAEDTAWVEARAVRAVDERPLDASEFHQLVQALEAAYRGAQGQPDPVRRNAALAVQAAGIIGGLFESYQASPFPSFELSRSFQQAHATHLAARAAQISAEVEAAARAGGDVEGAADRAKLATWAARLARRAVAGVSPTPVALSIRLATADGREVWWSVMAVDPDGVRNSAVCEAIVRPLAHEAHAGAGETEGFAIDVHGNDGALLSQFKGSGDDWRFVEDSGATPTLYRRLLAGELLDDVVNDLMQASMTLGDAA